MTTRTHYEFKGAQVEVRFTHYKNNNSLAVALFSTYEGRRELYAMASVNIDIIPAEGCFWCKDYSENEGIKDWLIENGIAEPTGRHAHAGYSVVDELRIIKHTDKIPALA